MRTLKALTLLCIAVSLAFLLGGCGQSSDRDLSPDVRAYLRTLRDAPLAEQANWQSDPAYQYRQFQIERSELRADTSWYQSHDY